MNAGESWHVHKHTQADRQSLESKRGEKWEAEKRRSLKFQGDTGEERRASSSSSSYAGLPTTGRLISMKMSLPLPWLPYGCHDTLGAWRTFSSRAVCECVRVWGGTVCEDSWLLFLNVKLELELWAKVSYNKRKTTRLTCGFRRQTEMCVAGIGECVCVCVCVVGVSSVNLALESGQKQRWKSS